MSRAFSSNCFTFFLLPLIMLAASFIVQGQGFPALGESRQQQKYFISNIPNSTKRSLRTGLNLSKRHMKFSQAFDMPRGNTHKNSRHTHQKLRQEGMAHRLSDERTVPAGSTILSTAANYAAGHMKFPQAFYMPRGNTHKTPRHTQQKLRHEGMARRLLDERMVSAGSTILSTAAIYAAVENTHAFNMQFGDDSNGNYAASSSTTRAGAAMIAADWDNRNASTEFVHKGNNSAIRGVAAKRSRTRGYRSNRVVHGNNGGSHDNKATIGTSSNPDVHGDSGDKNHEKVFDYARSRAALGDFTTSFHADYHNPRPHPPKNN